MDKRGELGSGFSQANNAMNSGIPEEDGVTVRRATDIIIFLRMVACALLILQAVRLKQLILRRAAGIKNAMSSIASVHVSLAARGRLLCQVRISAIGRGTTSPSRSP